MQEAYTYINMICIQNDYENIKASYQVNGEPKTISVKEWCAALREKYNEQINTKRDKKSELEKLQKNENKDENQINTLKQDIDKLDENIKTIESEIAQAETKIIEIFKSAKTKIDNDEECKDKEAQKTKIDNYIKGNEWVNIYSSAVNVNGKDSVDIKSDSRLNLFSNSNGIEISSTDDTINIKADKAISLSVGSNSITIDKDRISLVARKWMTSAGPTDSSIYLESITGTSISGLVCSMNSLFSSSMSDSFGGSISSSYGKTDMTGFVSTIHATSALHAKDYIFNVAKLIPHFCSAVKKDKAAYGTNVAKYTINSIGEAIDILEKFYHILDDIDKYKRENKKGDLLEIVIDILNIIFGVMDHVVTIMELEEAEYLQHNAGSISVRDA